MSLAIKDGNDYSKCHVRKKVLLAGGITDFSKTNE